MADATFIFESNFSVQVSTLKETSFDNKNSIYLCQDESQLVYDFDKIVKEQYPTKQPASYDALLIDGEKVYCIEFKNQKYSEIDREQITKKLTNGKTVLEEIFSDNSVNKREYKFIYCVVYKDGVARWRRGIEKNEVQFGLERYKGEYFDEIYTNDVQWFTHEYKKHFKKELAC
ncbi:hypothetical protein YH65_09375 [Sulfurovum lithotrophicum]|uniref:Uncharacterized protein n=1 Tax=Sulfurovum lithotrophicum TaxID=206403 RepID=A0A7U4M2N5_9BACT|nr:hypothetical protein [Sulfurovum lithotrophicum]AKF25564.1 hypothetical protein YH65_09375 [Sulfurovum lithotrophicum]